MLNIFPPRLTSFLLVAVVIAVCLAGCSHSKTDRGHLFRCDWAFEYNRTPWIGCPPDSGCENEDDDKDCGLFSCLKKDNSEKNRKGFRRHCGINSGCTAQTPCCRTLGCGMWVDPSDPTSFASLGGTAKACGLTPFCSPAKPCGLTPNCGKPVNVNVNPQTLLFNGQTQTGMTANGMTGRNITLGNGLQNGTGGMIRGMSPSGVAMQQGAIPGGAAGVPPAATLVGRGIVPGASTVTNGGIVTAIGVTTPVGTMTASGVRLPNGMVNNNVVLRACTMTPNCTAAHPCGLTPGCGGAVAVNMVSNNAMQLASALQAQGVASGVMQAGGMGTLVNPLTNQPINGLTMSGYPQAGYPPIGYAPTGYAPGYPRFAAEIPETEETEEEPAEEEPVLPEARSKMPVPQFHPIPSKPAFQRSEGMPPTPKSQRTVAKPTTTAMNEPKADLDEALDQAYLEGVAAAMGEVERKMEEKRQSVAKAKLQEKILRQSENVQQQLESQRELELQAMLAAEEPQRLPFPQKQVQQYRAREVAVSPSSVPVRNVNVAMTAQPQRSAGGMNVSQINTSLAKSAASLKTSVVSGMNGLLSPLLSSDEPKQMAVRKSAGNVPTAKPKTELAVKELPGRPPVAEVTPEYGLLPDEEPVELVQAQFVEEAMPKP